jgi:TIGR03009 family protein
MRHYLVALLAALAFAAGAIAQQAAPQPTPAGTPEQLNAHLAQWEREMAAVKSFSADCKRTDMNRVRNDRTELFGWVKCLKADAGGNKADQKASLYLAQKDNPNAFEKYVCTGDRLYRFSPPEKTVWVHKLGGPVAGDNFLEFLFQFKADAMKKRYDMTLVFPNGPNDPNYIYFDIKPRLEADKVEFQRARLVLLKKNYLPAQLWFEEPNGNYHTWELSKVQPNDPAVAAPDFVPPDKPAGWQMKDAKLPEAENQPRVIRPAKPS